MNRWKLRSWIPSLMLCLGAIALPLEGRAQSGSDARMAFGSERSSASRRVDALKGGSRSYVGGVKTYSSASGAKNFKAAEVRIWKRGPLVYLWEKDLSTGEVLRRVGTVNAAGRSWEGELGQQTVLSTSHGAWGPHRTEARFEFDGKALTISAKGHYGTSYVSETYTLERSR